MITHSSVPINRLRVFVRARVFARVGMRLSVCVFLCQDSAIFVLENGRPYRPCMQTRQMYLRRQILTMSSSSSASQRRPIAIDGYLRNICSSLSAELVQHSYLIRQYNPGDTFCSRPSVHPACVRKCKYGVLMVYNTVQCVHTCYKRKPDYSIYSKPINEMQ